MTNSYAEFRITLVPDEHADVPVRAPRRYRTEALGPNDDEAVSSFANPLAAGEIQAALSSIPGAASSLRRSGPNESLDPVKDLGARLYTALLTGPVERAFARALEASDGVRTRIVVPRSDESAQAIPWEFLYDLRRDDFFVLSTRSPLVRSVPEVASSPLAPIKPPVRILAVASDVTGAWQVAQEFESMRIAAQRSDAAQLRTLSATTWYEFVRAIDDFLPHVVHLIATGIDGQPGSGALGQQLAFIADSGEGAAHTQGYALFNGESLSSSVKRSPDLRLVVLNGCRTDGIAMLLAPAVPAVIAHRGDITDEGALAFTGGLYPALLSGLPLEAAVTAARLHIDKQIPGGREWCAPVFYLQTHDGTFLASRQDRLGDEPSVLPRETPSDLTTSGEARERLSLESLVAIHEANLRALREQRAEGGEHVPPYVSDQIKSTTSEIERLKRRISAIEIGA